MKINRINIGEVIRMKVAEKGISKAAFAKSIGIQRQNIDKSVFERMSLDTELLCRISEQLECNLFLLYCGGKDCNINNYSTSGVAKEIKATLTIETGENKQDKVFRFIIENGNLIMM